MNITRLHTAVMHPESRLWFLEIITGIVVLILLNLLLKRILRHIREKAVSSPLNWKERVEYIVFLPFQVLLWVLGITLVVEILGRRFTCSFFEEHMNAFRSTGFVFCVSWALLRWQSIFQKLWLNKQGRDRQIDIGFAQVISKVLVIAIVSITGMLILSVWGLNIGPLIAFGGVGAAAIGFAAKDVLANLFGGLMLQINRPFMLGDNVLLPAHNLEGCIEHIGWNVTTVRDKDKRPVYLPNATFSNVLLVNATRMTHRRILTKVSVGYESFANIGSLIDEIREGICHHGDIDSHLPLIVVFDAFGENGLDILIDCYTLQTRYEDFLRVKHEVLALIYGSMLNKNIKMASASIVVSGELSRK